MNFSKRIDEYLGGHLSDAEQKLFDDELVKNEKLRRKVELCRELREAVNEPDVVELREKLNNALNHSKGQKRVYLKVLTLATAASVVLFFAIHLFLINSTPNHEKLFQTYFQPYQLVGEVRASLENAQGGISSEIKRLYHNKNFEDVIPFIETYLSENPNDQQAYLMLSSAYLVLGKNEIAEETLLRAFGDRNDNLYKETLDWYFALSLLKQGKVEEAKKIFDKIEKGKGFYSTKALSIINSL